MFSVSTSSKAVSRRGAPAACALILLAGAAGASAATGSGASTGGWYATGILGAVTQSDQRLAYSRPGVTAVTSSTLPLDTGFAAGGAIGALLMLRGTSSPILLTTTINGSLGGLVGVTAGCATMLPGFAILTGLVAGAVVVLGMRLLDSLRLDDVVGAVPVHVV